MFSLCIMNIIFYKGHADKTIYLYCSINRVTKKNSLKDGDLCKKCITTSKEKEEDREKEIQRRVIEREKRHRRREVDTPKEKKSSKKPKKKKKKKTEVAKGPELKETEVTKEPGLTLEEEENVLKSPIDQIEFDDDTVPIITDNTPDAPISGDAPPTIVAQAE